MEENKEYTYYAFISYKREEEGWAKWLQRKLERYRFPTNLNGREDLPKRIYPTFRDVTDLNPGQLELEIDNALRDSEWLIVMCSPKSAQSPWVCKEAQTFIDLGRADHIIPFVIDGTPFSDDIATECYPEALRNLTGKQELLAANISEMGRDAAAIKVVARMFNLRFDTLWQRYERELRKRRNWIISGVASIILILLGVTGFILNQNKNLRQSNSRAAASAAERLIEEGDYYTARRVAVAALEKAYTPEAEMALRHAYLRKDAFGLRGDDSPVESVAFTPSGKKIISCSERGTIYFWDVGTGRLIDTIDNVFCGGNFIISSDEKRMAVIHRGQINIVSFFDLITGFRNDYYDCIAAAFSPDSKLFVVVDEMSGLFYLWDANTHQCVDSIKVPTKHGDCHSVIFRPDGKIIAAFDQWPDDVTAIWDVYENRCLCKLHGISFKEFSTDGEKFIYTLNDNTIHIREVATGQSVSVLKGHSSWIKSVKFSLDGNKVVSSSDDSTIRIWNVSTGQCLSNHKSIASSVAFSPDGRNITSVERSIVHTGNFEGEKDEQVKVLPNYWPQSLNNILFLDEKHIWCCYSDKIRVVDMRTNQCIDSIDVTAWGVISPNMKMYAETHGNDINIFDINTKKCIKTLKEHIGVRYAKFSPNGKMIASASYDKVRIWDINTGKCLHILRGLSPYVDITFSPDGRRLITQTDTIIRIWNVSTGRCLRTTDGFGNITFSPDGKKIASCSRNGNVHIWNTSTGRCIRILRGHTDFVNSISFSLDGKKVVTGSDDGTIRIWNSYTGRCIRILKGLHEVLSVAFSPNGEIIASRSCDHTFRIWDVRTGKCLYRYYDDAGELHLPDNNILFSPDGDKIIFPMSEWNYGICDFPDLQKIKSRTLEQFKDNPLTLEERRLYYLE